MDYSSSATPTPTPTPNSTTPHQQAHNVYHFKILVPAAAAGRIIGKGGTTIAQLQKDAGARVKMSKASEFYPGTTERICLISGPIDGILKINDFFLENFSSTSVKILVPNSTAGMIIGKAGNYIKQIKEESGAYVQISQKCSNLSLPERCVTIVGELVSIRKACVMILAKIVEDVGSAYRDIRTPSITTSVNSTSSTTTSISSGHVNNNSSNISNINNNITTSNGNGTSTTLSTASSTPISVIPSSPTASNLNSAQIIESIKLVLRVSGYGEEAVTEVTSAMSTLASYGVLGVGLGLF